MAIASIVVQLAGIRQARASVKSADYQSEQLLHQLLSQRSSQTLHDVLT
jgi:hypothetical protein